MNDDAFLQDEEPIDDEIHEMEREKPSVNEEIQDVEITPVLTDEQYRSLRDCYLTPAHALHKIEPNKCYIDKTAGPSLVKFLVLPHVLKSCYGRALDGLNGADWNPSNRAGVKGQRKARKITYGFFPQEPFFIRGNKWLSVRSSATMKQPALAYALRPLIREMNRRLIAELPFYVERVRDLIMGQAGQRDDEEDDWSKIPLPPAALEGVRDPVKIVKEVSETGWGKNDPFPPTYTLWGTVFSSLEMNRHGIFKAHEDSDNVAGTLVCIAALGNYAGGRLVLPRYGYYADLQPGDLLICDNKNELHGNLGPLSGESTSPRYSVVAFLHQNVLDYANRKGLWAPETKTSTPFRYTSNFQSKEETDELAAYFETLDFHKRKTKWGKEIKRQSLGYIARNAFDDR
jgi:hypothetical protein